MIVDIKLYENQSQHNVLVQLFTDVERIHHENLGGSWREELKVFS